MERKNQEAKAELLLSIVQLNKQKLNVLSKMMELELEGKILVQEYIELIDIYEMICVIQRKKLISISFEDKNKLSEVIYDFNPLSSRKVLLPDLLKMNGQSLVLRKTLIDLGEPLYILYPEKDPRLDNPVFQALCESFGVTSEEGKEDRKQINEYMVSDFMNFLFTNIENQIKQETEEETKRELLTWKYHSIFLDDDLERRALQTKFLVPDYPYLTDSINIEIAGLSLENYIDKLESIMSNTATWVIEKIVSDCKRFPGKIKVDLLVNLFVKTYLDLIKDKETICDCLLTTITEAQLEGESNPMQEIIHILEEAKKEKVDIIKVRSFPTI